MTTTTITPAEIREGDVLVGPSVDYEFTMWRALQDAITDNPAGTIVGTGVRVQHRDGGIDWRFWDTDTDVRFEVTETEFCRELRMVTK